MRGTGRTLFTALMLIVVGVLNIFYGIGALDNANVFAGDTRLVFSDLNTYGWFLIVLAIIVLIFGANRLPELGRGIGKGIRNFKDATKDGTEKS